MAAIFSTCLLCMVLGGFYAYVVLPADYTCFHRWTLALAASPLGDQHGHAGTMVEALRAQPTVAAQLQERVARERGEYLRDWLTVTLGGLLVPLLALLAWSFRRGRRLTPART